MNYVTELPGKVTELRYALAPVSFLALGALFMGWAGDHVGLGLPVVAGAVLCGIVFLVMLRHEPRLSMAAERGSLPAPL